MKYKQLKLMISALIFIVGLWMNIYFSTNLHFLLTRKMNVLTFVPIKSCFESMAASGQHLSLFLYLQGFILLCSIYFYLANMKPYQSDLEEITPDIATPVRAGQMQFGSARWLTEEEKNKGFKFIKLRKNELKTLMERIMQDEEKETSSKKEILSEGEALQRLSVYLSIENSPSGIKKLLVF
ncbi:MAG: hypothetical protein ACOWWR_00240 [Eubacteriales bacterium]